MASFNSWYCAWRGEVLSEAVFTDEALVQVKGEEPNRARLGWLLLVPATSSTPSEHINVGVLNEAISAVQSRRQDWEATLWIGYKEAQKQHMEGWKIEEYNAVQRQQLKRRKLRTCKSVKAKEWGKSLAASEAVPDNHDKNSVSTTGEKLNISVVT